MLLFLRLRLQTPEKVLLRYNVTPGTPRKLASSEQRQVQRHRLEQAEPEPIRRARSLFEGHAAQGTPKSASRGPGTFGSSGALLLLLQGVFHDALHHALACLLFLQPFSLTFSFLQSADLFREIFDAAASQQCLGVHVGHDATHLSQS